MAAQLSAAAGDKPTADVAALSSAQEVQLR